MGGSPYSSERVDTIVFCCKTHELCSLCIVLRAFDGRHGLSVFMIPSIKL